MLQTCCSPALRDAPAKWLSVSRSAPGADEFFVSYSRRACCSEFFPASPACSSPTGELWECKRSRLISCLTCAPSAWTAGCLHLLSAFLFLQELFLVSLRPGNLPKLI